MIVKLVFKNVYIYAKVSLFGLNQNSSSEITWDLLLLCFQHIQFLSCILRQKGQTEIMQTVVICARIPSANFLTQNTRDLIFTPIAKVNFAL